MDQRKNFTAASVCDKFHETEILHTPVLSQQVFLQYKRTNTQSTDEAVINLTAIPCPSAKAQHGRQTAEHTPRVAKRLKEVRNENKNSI
jgi:hypothetical protein